MLLDLFRYSAPGVLSFTWGTPAYFSIDGGVTDLRDFSTSGDPQDWSGGTDPSDCAGFGYAGVVQGFSSVDFMLLDVIGYSTVAMATPVNGQCGPTNGVTTGTAPTSGLCNQGTASSVNTTSTNFTWSCMGSGGGSTASCSAPMPVVAPAAATNLHASVTSTTSKGKHATTTYQVNLGWSQGGGVTSDKIYRATGSGSFALISTSSSGITSFVDKNVTQGTTYIYYVIAANPGGVSPASTTVVITP
jgi:hypothetical protein